VIRGIFDTGSANMWIMSTWCTTGDCTWENHNMFNPDLSSTFSATTYETSIEFGSGVLAGTFGVDTAMVMSGNDGETITVTDQTFGLITEE
jgi:pepsin A